MDARAFSHARRAVAKAGTALERLRAANDRDELVDAWEDFLHSSAKVYEKLKAGARGDSKAWGWFNRAEQERSQDELLRYVHHARNSDFHRFEEIALFDAGGVAVGGPGTGITVIDHMGIDRGKVLELRGVQFGATRAGVREVPAHLRPLDVTDRGEVYAAPTSHLGNLLRTRSVLEVAELMVAYLRTLEIAASHFVR